MCNREEFPVSDARSRELHPIFTHRDTTAPGGNLPIAGRGQRAISGKYRGHVACSMRPSATPREPERVPLEFPHFSFSTPAPPRVDFVNRSQMDKLKVGARHGVPVRQTTRAPARTQAQGRRKTPKLKNR